MALGSTQPLTDMSTRSISWGKGGRCVRLSTLPPSCALVMKSGNLNFLEPSGPLQACNGAALPLPLFYSYLRYFSLTPPSKLPPSKLKQQSKHFSYGRSADCTRPAFVIVRGIFGGRFGNLPVVMLVTGLVWRNRLLMNSVLILQESTWRCDLCLLTFWR